VCRQAFVRHGEVTGGPLNIYWHGTYQNAVEVQEFGAGGSVLEMTLDEGGIAVYPEADPDAVNRPNQPFPWWIVGTLMDDRPDDYRLFDEIVGCALQTQDIDPDRINTGGLSAGGIMTSTLLQQRGYMASAVSWSGGHFEPMVPAGDTPAMVLHGGPNDCYCGAGVTSCYCFMEPSEDLAADMVDAGNFAFLCDHSMGDTSVDHHTDAMGPEGAEFMMLARFGQPHPWHDYEFGRGGHYMLDNYCYAVGDVSPWAPWD
jgi:hypothetical protein